MANEKRLRLLALTTGGGLVRLSSPLYAQTPGYADTITLNGALSYGDGSLVSIGADQYLPVIIDPDTAQAEEAWIVTTPTGSGTSYTASITRGVGSSTGAPPHSSNAVVVSGPTPYDRLLSIDDPWGGNLGYDYEFQGDTTSLPSYSFNGTIFSWSWLNQGTSSYQEAWGQGVLKLQAGSGDTLRGMALPVPTQASYTITTKRYLAGPNVNISAGVGFYDGTKLVTLATENNQNEVQVSYWNSVTSFNTNLVNTSFAANGAAAQYYQIAFHSSSSVDFLYSPNGVAWYTLASSINLSTYLTPSYLVLFSNTNGGACTASTQFFRVR